MDFKITGNECVDSIELIRVRFCEYDNDSLSSLISEGPALNQLNPVHTFTSYFFKFHSNVI
jgi:hypothetical protein